MISFGDAIKKAASGSFIKNSQWENGFVFLQEESEFSCEKIDEKIHKIKPDWDRTHIYRSHLIRCHEDGTFQLGWIPDQLDMESTWEVIPIV